MPSTRSRNSLTPTSVHHADIMAKPASTVSAPTEMVAIDEDMPGIYDFIANAPSSTLAGSAPVPWIPAPLYIDEDFVASPVPSPPAAETSEAEFDIAFEEELANMPIPTTGFDYKVAYHSLQETNNDLGSEVTHLKDELFVTKEQLGIEMCGSAV